MFDTSQFGDSSDKNKEMLIRTIGSKRLGLMKRVAYENFVPN